MTAPRWEGSQFVISMRPPVIAAAAAKVPASMRSGMTRCAKGAIAATPSIATREVPSPSILAPAPFRRPRELRDLGLPRGVFDHGPPLRENGRHDDIHGRPDARDPERYLGAPELPGARVDIAVLDRELRPERGETLEMEIDGAGSPRAAARHGNARLAEARDERAERVYRGPHRAHEIVGRLERRYPRGVDRANAARERRDDPEAREQGHHGAGVLEIGDVLERARPAGEHRGRHEGKHGVLRAAHTDASVEPARPLDDESIHRTHPSPSAQKPSRSVRAR